MESDALGSRTGFGGGLHSAGTEQRDTLPDIQIYVRDSALEDCLGSIEKPQ